MKKKKQVNAKIIIRVLIFIILIFILYNLFLMYSNIEINNYSHDNANISTITRNNYSIEANESTEDMLENAVKSVVGISRLKSADGSILNNISSEDLGLGTGIIISENGYILSNSHVTGDRFSICYVTIEETSYKGTVIFSEPDLDLSIIKISANNLKPIKLGDSSIIKVGNAVYAIGNPIGYEFRRTVTSGIISAFKRTIKIEEGEEVRYISDLIQTDATINPGNSGGPLVNSNGEVIGINTVKITSAEGIGFAIPINVIKPVIEKIIQNNQFEEASLGIYAFDSEVAEYMNLKNKNISGVYISQILPNKAGFKFGLKEGDVITNIDGKRIKTLNDLREYLYSKQPEDNIVLKIVRNEKEFEISVILGKR